MFIKERDIPHEVIWLPRLLVRLPNHHASYEDIHLYHYQKKAGYGGEKRVDGYLKKSSDKKKLIIGDLQLGPRSCQIDTLVLTPYFILILEVKNFSGKLVFDEKSFHMKQYNRDEKLVGHNSPVTQAWHAREEMILALEDLEISLPVFTSVVLPYSTTFVESVPDDIPVIYAYSLNRFISTLPRTGKPLSATELTKVGQQILSLHTPFPRTDYLDTFNLSVSHLRKGVLCNNCGNACLKITQRHHKCTRCEITISNGYEDALDDWFELVSPEITNIQCRDFLRMKDRHAAKYLLKKMALRKSGKSRGRIYMK